MDWIMGALSELNIFDRLNTSTHRLGFGGGYEALYWSSADMAFRYVEQVLYFVVVCQVDANGAVTGRPEVAVNDVVHYQTMEECSVLSFSRLVDGADYTMWAMTQPELRIPQKR